MLSITSLGKELPLTAQEHYITQTEHDQRMSDFTGYIGHVVNTSKADLRREITQSEDRLRTEIQAVKAELSEHINQVEQRLDKVEQRLDKVENMGKLNHQMLQMVLEQLSKISKKLGTD
jgi:TolA-binding protein